VSKIIPSSKRPFADQIVLHKRREEKEKEGGRERESKKYSLLIPSYLLVMRLN
jgi:hypothetical protein